MKLSALSQQYYPVTISAVLNSAPHDPTGDAVQFSFAQEGVEPSVWHSGIWETWTGGPYAVAKVLIGPGAVVVAAGSYVVWIKVTDSPETPVFSPGELEITDP